MILPQIFKLHNIRRTLFIYALGLATRAKLRKSCRIDL